MNINRHNYEEFFLLYADNELSAAEKQAVDGFVLQNPDLGEELNILMQLRIVPDEKIQFEQKEILYQAEMDQNNGITETNYEDYLLSFIDNELNGDERQALEKFLGTHPVAKQELEILQRAKLQADKSLVFADKSVLYRTTEERVRVIKMTWWKVAAAAAVIIVAGLLWLNRPGNEKINDTTTLAKLEENKTNTPSDKKSSPEVVTKKEDARNTINNAGTGLSESTESTELNASEGHEKIKEESITRQSVASTQESGNETRNRKEMKREESLKTIEQGSEEVKSVAAISMENKTNSLPVPEVIATPETKSTALPTAKNIIDKPALSEEVKTNYASEALLREDYQIDVARAEEPETRKGLFRGLVRKANRVLNKVTNPDPKKSSVRVAGFEIALAK